jgi:hypothetical protein
MRVEGNPLVSSREAPLDLAPPSARRSFWLPLYTLTRALEDA